MNNNNNDRRLISTLGRHPELKIKQFVRRKLCLNTNWFDNQINI